MKKKVFNTPFSRSVIPWDDWQHLLETKYDHEKEINIFPGKASRTEDGALSKGFVTSRQLIPRPKGVRGSSDGAWKRRMWDLLNFDGDVSVRCCNKLHTLRLEKDLTLTALEHDDLDALRMMQTFGDEGSLRCLEIVDVWNKLVPTNCTNILMQHWELREERQKLPKELRAVYDHFRSVFSFHQAENNLTSRRKRYSSQIEPVSKTLGSRIHTRARKIVQDYANKNECWYITYSMSREDNIRWFKNVKNRGLDKVYRESDWLEFVKARDAAEQSGFVPSVHGCNEQLSWPVLNATENGGNYIVLSPPVEKPERPSNHWSFGWSDLRFYTVEKRTCGYLGNILVIPNTITVGGE
jgi:hypothetical protein